jgi:hypothetical protein
MSGDGWIGRGLKKGKSSNGGAFEAILAETASWMRSLPLQVFATRSGKFTRPCDQPVA